MYGNIRKPMLKSVMAAENKTEPEQPGEGTGGMPIFCCCVQSAISLMKWSIPRAKPPGRRFQEAQDRMSVASGSSGWIPYIHFISEI